MNSLRQQYTQTTIMIWYECIYVCVHVIAKNIFCVKFSLLFEQPSNFQAIKAQSDSVTVDSIQIHIVWTWISNVSIPNYLNNLFESLLPNVSSGFSGINKAYRSKRRRKRRIFFFISLLARSSFVNMRTDRHWLNFPQTTPSIDTGCPTDKGW